MDTWWRRLAKSEYSGLLLLVIITLALHFSIILQPAELAFDEQHYVKDARAILAGQDTQRPEHPPLAKLIIVSGVYLFGDNPGGWRFFSVIFGTLCIIFFYLLCRRLASREVSLLATFLLSLENLTFLQASVAMLDVFSLAFTLLSFWLFLKGKYWLAGLAVGLSALAKLNGALAIVVIGVYWLITRRAKFYEMAMTAVVAPVSFLALMPLCNFAINRQFMDPIAQVRTMLSLSGSLTFASVKSEILSRPWEWVLYPKVMYYWYTPHYVGAISFNIWALIIPAVGYMIFRAIKRDQASFFGLAWFFGTYLVWIPASIVTDRVSFLYYFYPTVGAICLGLGLGMSRLLDVWRRRRTGKLRWVALLSVCGFLLIHVAVFVILAPVFYKWVKIFPILPQT